MGRKKLLNSNIFLINSSICLVVFLTILYVSLGNSFKGTHSVAAGDCYMTENGEVCIDTDTEVYGEYKFKIGRITDDADVNLNFMADGKKFIGFKIKFDSPAVSLWYKTAEEGTLKAGEYNINSGSWTMHWFDIEALNIQVTEKQTIDATSALFFEEHTEPVNKCYYNEYSNTFTWTNLFVGRESSYDTSDLCDRAVAVVLKDNTDSISMNGHSTPHYYYGLEGDTFSVSHFYSLGSNVILDRSGYVLKGWNTNADGSGTQYTNDQTITLNSNLTLYAQWEEVKETYTVTFNANGGTGTMNNQTFVSGVSQKLSVNQFTKANYTFKGWNTKADGSGIKYKDNESIVVTSNMTLYAIWGEQTDNFNIVIDGYKVDLTNKIISVPLGTTESQFISNISYDTSIFYHKVDTKLVAGDRLLYTDAKFKIYELRGTSNAIEEYTIAVLGDVNGDGELSTMDYVLVYNHLDNSSKLSGIYTYAADMYSDDDITTMDYVMIYNALGGN